MERTQSLSTRPYKSCILLSASLDLSAATVPCLSTSLPVNAGAQVLDSRDLPSRATISALIFHRSLELLSSLCADLKQISGQLHPAVSFYPFLAKEFATHIIGFKRPSIDSATGLT